jgi:chromate transporter
VLPPEHPSRAAAFRYWLKLGFISFGGPAGQISLMHQELVERRRWISERRFLHALNYTMLLPGPEAQQLATYIGWLMHGTWGGIVAGTLFVLPSLGLLMLLAWGYLVFGQLPAVAGILYGIKPAVVAIVLFAGYRIGSRTLRNPLLWSLALGAFVAIAVFSVPFPALVMSALLIGSLLRHRLPAGFTPTTAHGGQPGLGSAVIGDDTPPPAHARFSGPRLMGLAATGLALWLALMLVLVQHHGWQGTFTQMGWFFSKAALVTFGGAYAVLPYVVQNAVEGYQWLTAQQMIDGLALGETTPGPLIMIVAFVGFLGGWNQAALGPDWLWAAGVMGALVATFFTFLPSFLFILVGGPLVEATRHDLKFTAPLTAVTAAVVGVIAHLAVFLALHVLWPKGWAAGFEWPAAVLAAMALLALYRQSHMVAVIAACGGAGLIYTVGFG